MRKVKAERFGELFVKNMLILQSHFATLDLETADLHRQLTNFRKFPELTTLHGIEQFYRCNHLMPLHFKGLTTKHHCISVIHSTEV